MFPDGSHESQMEARLITVFGRGFLKGGMHSSEECPSPVFQSRAIWTVSVWHHLIPLAWLVIWCLMYTLLKFLGILGGINIHWRMFQGLFDVHIKLLRVPLLDWEPPPLASHLSARWRSISCVGFVFGKIWDLLAGLSWVTLSTPLGQWKAFRLSVMSLVKSRITDFPSLKMENLQTP